MAENIPGGSVVAVVPEVEKKYISSLENQLTSANEHVTCYRMEFQKATVQLHGKYDEMSSLRSEIQKLTHECYRLKMELMATRNGGENVELANLRVENQQLKKEYQNLLQRFRDHPEDFAHIFHYPHQMRKLSLIIHSIDNLENLDTDGVQFTKLLLRSLECGKILTKDNYRGPLLHPPTEPKEKKSNDKSAELAIKKPKTSTPEPTKAKKSKGQTSSEPVTKKPKITDATDPEETDTDQDENQHGSCLPKKPLNVVIV